jgi:integrase
MTTARGIRQTPKRKLTQKAVAALKPAAPGTGEYWVRDAELHGFMLRVREDGSKVFMVRYGDRRRRRSMTIGYYGPVTAEDAREKAQVALGKVADGLDPAADAEAERKVPTFAAWVATYLEHVATRKKSAKDDRSYLGMVVKKWEGKLLTDITTEDVEKLVQSVHATGAKAKGNRVLASVRACLQHAWRLDLIPSNPAMKVRAMPEPAPRTRVLTDKELERLGTAVAALEDVHIRAAFALMMLTGCRRSEVLRAKWEDVDLDAATWRLPSTKSGRPQTIPLPAAAVAILAELPRVGPLVVPGGRDSAKPRPDLKDPWEDLQAAADIADVHLHDIRRTVGLSLARKAGLHIASRLLRHSDIRVTERHYAPLGLAELAKASETHSRTTAKVLPFVPAPAAKRRKAGGR